MVARSNAGRLHVPVRLAVVVPCYNETEVLETTIPRLLSLLDELVERHNCARDSYVLFIDDGSTDDTWLKISRAVDAHPGRVRAIRLSCNAGHQSALLAGLDYATGRCDAAVSIDADLQDDPAAIPRMLEAYRAGAEMVLGVRESREVDTWFKRNSALGFYKLMRRLGVKLVENHADFRLMSAAVLGNLARFPERNLFLRALPPLLHSSVATVTYRRTSRLAGESKYPLGKMLALAWNGITSFSVAPLRLISLVGGMVFLASLLMIAYALVGYL
ncbi:MAG TPA: glycosyltransferase family 2 protein, partial [Rhodocyclaceae bacterium]|nr:glycosyltransferase family 2 protein [Rhodocyclaceae bacterium]